MPPMQTNFFANNDNDDDALPGVGRSTAGWQTLSRHTNRPTL